MHARCHDEKVGKRILYITCPAPYSYLYTFTLEYYYVIRDPYNKQQWNIKFLIINKEGYSKSSNCIFVPKITYYANPHIAITHRIFSWETRNRGILWRGISHEENRREKREIGRSKKDLFREKYRKKFGKLIFFFYKIWYLKKMNA